MKGDFRNIAAGEKDVDSASELLLLWPGERQAPKGLPRIHWSGFLISRAPLAEEVNN